MLISWYRKFKKDRKAFLWAIYTYIVLLVVSRLTASLSSVSQEIIKLLQSPFKLWIKIAPLKTSKFDPNPFFEWGYILFSILLISFICYGLFIYFFTHKDKNIAKLLCEEEVSKITTRIETNPGSLTDDTVIDLLRKFEDGYSEIFSIENKSNFLCVWLYPQELKPGATHTNEWIAFCTDKTSPAKYIDIIQTGVLKTSDHKHFSCDLKDYNTDIKEYAFMKNMGAFKFGVAILFKEENKVTEKTKKDFIVSSSLIHHIAQLDKHIMSVL